MWTYNYSSNDELRHYGVQHKANKQMYKADKKRYSPFSSEKSVRKARVKASKAQNKVNRKVYKAKKWIDNMSKAFEKTPQAMSREQLTLGKKYTQQLTRNTKMNDFMFKLREG
jgi:hypothetical protein